ncbi:MAG: hypothetical protein IJT94_02735, partial [Oscillibacter sp.]|nr:hypothetical protein [Oscillibacter sp.]
MSGGFYSSSYYPESREEFERRARAERIRRRRARREEARRQAVRTLLGLLLSGILAAVVLGALLIWPRTADSLTVEAGTPLPEAADFVRGGIFHAEILSGLYEAGASTVLGDRVVKLSIAGRERTTLVRVVDTIPPAVETKDVSLVNASVISPEQFIASIQDATETTVSFVQPPDLSAAGVQEVGIAVTDAGENRTEVQAKLELLVDNTPPTITGTGELTVV